MAIIKLKDLLMEGAKEKATLDFLKQLIRKSPYEGKVFLAGGAVRDELMGIDANDLDFVINLEDGGAKFAEWATKKIGNYKKFGKTVNEHDRLIQTSVDFENAGSEFIVLELVEESLADKITNLLKIPTIGIGSGKNVDGQVLVLYDILGIGSNPSFAKDFLVDSSSIEESVGNFIRSVKNNTYP